MVGVVLIGVIYMDEFVCGVIGVNLYYGVVYLLVDLMCMMGGLLSGFVVVVVVGYVLFVLGSDMNGLICVLVVLCGVWGFCFGDGWLLWIGCLLYVVLFDIVGGFVNDIDDFVVLYDMLCEVYVLCLNLVCDLGVLLCVVVLIGDFEIYVDVDV